MKKWFYIFLMLIFMPFAKAEVSLGAQSTPTTSQQTGGNYIYAENGKLTFNFEPSVFEGRQWQYNASIDGAVTTFDLKQMPIKTKHSSTFYGYEITQNGELNLVAYYEEVRPPMLIKPVYRKGYEGRVVKVWLPQAAGWVVRVVGSVARSVVPPVVTNAARLCVKNDKCTALVIGNLIPGGLFCAINYYSDNAIQKVFKLPENVCSKAEEDGWTKDENGQYVRNVNYNYCSEVEYGYGYGNGSDEDKYLRELSEQAMPTENIGAKTLEELEKKLKNKCYANIGQKFNELDYPEELARGDDFGTITKVNFNKSGATFYCSVSFTDEKNDYDGVGDLLPAVPVSFRASSDSCKVDKKETLQFVDLSNYVAEDFKKDPNPYINDTGQVGKEIREKIQSSASLMKKDGSKGTLNVSSAPYKNPQTGDTMQDLLSIKSGTSWEVPPNAGGTSSGGGGGTGGGGVGGNGTGGEVPQGTNDVSVTTIARPDQADTAKDAENNNANGTGVNSSAGIGGGTGNNGSSTGGGNNQGGNGGKNGNGSGNQAASGAGQDGLKCDEENKGALACASLGSVEESAFDGIAIPTKTDATTYQYDGFLPSSGACPAPKIFHVAGKEFQISYDALCSFVSQIRFAVLIGFAVMAAFIAFGGLKKS